MGQIVTCLVGLNRRSGGQIRTGRSNDSHRFQTPRLMEKLDHMLQGYAAKLKDADDITLRGYVQMPRVVLYAKSLSDGDKVTHLLLLSFAWQAPSCFPAQATLGDMRGRSPRQIRRNLASLAKHGFIRITQNGSARANTYEVLCRVGKEGLVITPDRRGDVADVEFQDADDFSLGGFVQVPVALLEDSNLGDGAILTYAVIADQGTRCPSQEDMAVERGIRRPAFSSHVSELVKRGYMDVKKEAWGQTLTYVRRHKFRKPAR